MSGVDTAIILAIITLAGVVFAPLFPALLQRLPSRSNAIQSNTQTINNLSQQVQNLAAMVQTQRERNDQLEERIDALQRDLRKFKNAYAKAIRYIYEKDPTAEIPNFLIDTDPKQGTAK